ncbi:hypothetical protein PVL29_017096 [Vitis rotundifolia]|uniref:Uncharacterized protein n=1 Tax=Vitis rotundifolia TaxID=103349 RepID=A0AA39DIK7_VITRO|nr:hypothetical protein PVL29_017096 [Vitis rotundifolia]
MLNYGLSIVATKNGGHADIIKKEHIETLTYRASSNCNYSVSHNLGRRQELYVIDFYKKIVENLRCYQVNLKEFDTLIYNELKQMNDRLRELMAYNKMMQIRGFHCCLIHMQIASRLNVIPLSTSRVQALRHLSIRWGIDLSIIVVFVWKRCDTNYEDLLVGLHKAIILRSFVKYGREDTIPQDSPCIAFIEKGYEAQDIYAALLALGIK